MLDSETLSELGYAAVDFYAAAPAFEFGLRLLERTTVAPGRCRFCGVVLQRKGACCAAPACRSRDTLERHARIRARIGDVAWLEQRNAWRDPRRAPCADCGAKRERRSQSPRCAICRHRRLRAMERANQRARRARRSVA